MLFSNNSLFSNVNILILVRYNIPLCQTDMEAQYAIAYHPAVRVNLTRHTEDRSLISALEMAALPPSHGSNLSVDVTT